ncbi:ribosomal-protein-alanine N-acetyltransferase [Clostridium tepidiprofundi DSM 19306]|uniref:Ribosomal-protein-alanine N-acetyltransferase n=1 Tax=Clostridium tepidiprofundi DSM 19306 TaxID=1121338 RepID=A0A151B740_9CLOT|nr:GNAT family N-acetyltransferase [Clostridium tepidiprofundi]KYH35748.1 ribosomal-protein-alanine N-acetyltransferase [Clostridium tepidiprofundi DSM 19306]
MYQLKKVYSRIFNYLKKSFTQNSFLNDKINKIEVYEMTYNLNDFEMYQFNDDDIKFVNFTIDKDEQLRCDIQNEIFNAPYRIPLQVTDIYWDEKQSYYRNEWSIFLKKGEQFIGYGQIILQDDIPQIVNLGIKKEFRGYGYGKQLLYYLLSLLVDTDYDSVKIRVEYKNNIAIDLYTKIGFI